MSTPLTNDQQWPVLRKRLHQRDHAEDGQISDEPLEISPRIEQAYFSKQASSHMLLSQSTAPANLRQRTHHEPKRVKSPTHHHGLNRDMECI
jgi:hypothetical protein